MHPNRGRRNTRPVKISLAQATLFGRTGTPPDPARLDARGPAAEGTAVGLIGRHRGRPALAPLVVAHAGLGGRRHG
jgi:hypothetical protein